ncbi:Ultraviolet light resistance protein RulA, partial [Pseudomonas savastanoi]
MYVHTVSSVPCQVRLMNVKILGRLCGSGKVIPFYTFKIPAGFPNPAADHIEQDFSFDRLMDLRAPHIYVAKIDGDSMEGAKIFHDSLVVVDR